MQRAHFRGTTFSKAQNLDQAVATIANTVGDKVTRTENKKQLQILGIHIKFNMVGYGRPKR